MRISQINITGCTIGDYKCNCFEKLSADQIQLLEANSVIIKYKKGEIICKQGGYASHIMFMENGLAKVFIDDGNTTLVLKIIPSGSFIGLASVSDEFPTFQYSSTAYINSEIRQIELGAFKKIMSENPEFTKDIIDILSSNSVQIYGRFFCLSNKQSFGRMADIIVCISDRIFKSREFELPLSRKDLGDLTGMSSETVIRILSKFKDEGLIEINDKRFKILDYDKLKKISENG